MFANPIHFRHHVDSFYYDVAKTLLQQVFFCPVGRYLGSYRNPRADLQFFYWCVRNMEADLVRAPLVKNKYRVLHQLEDELSCF